MESNEVTKFIEHFKKIYSNRMTVYCGKIHKYLGMDLDFSTPQSPQDWHDQPVAVTPAAEHLFEVCKDNKDKLLSEEQTLAFHRTTAQLLFLSAHARPDIQGPGPLMRMTGAS
eukprot:3257865-Ditylum_brightwellii.AAC.1